MEQRRITYFSVFWNEQDSWLSEMIFKDRSFDESLAQVWPYPVNYTTLLYL